MSDHNSIRNVSDTALWVAIYRAMESERPDALFRDPYARRLGGARGEAIVRELPDGETMSWPLVVRTAVIDEIVTRGVREGARTVLNLAAGLDARPYRMDLPADLRWIHVDMPDMVDFFRDRMAGETPRCRLEYVAADLREADRRREVLADAGREGPVLVITEGLLLYLQAEDVAALARDLHDVAKARWWVADLASPALLRRLEKTWSPTLRAGNAPFVFGPRENTGFFAPFGWRELEFRSHWDESIRLKRTMPRIGFWRIMMALTPAKRRAKMKRISGMMLLRSEH
ncbi:SAM-dependent methyltransferase [Lysobacter hankyongensis]|uniref:S-adenosyl-L-methionine-dependent methyltransferase n=1 Tax=Lysobacter hankyongensis TaxID=1176535 RepID=A0ABP9BSZ8_9GAMM